MSLEFRFPSNGKAFLNWEIVARALLAIRVSIPFKREGVSEQIGLIQLALDRDMFRFPSNGKAFLNAKAGWVYNLVEETERVSIPFKREGVSERQAGKTWKEALHLVVSIPFKREGVSELARTVCPCQGCYAMVSIPFKREGVSELHAAAALYHRPIPRFDSLQTGRRF